MSRIFWDSMLFVYLLEGDDHRAGRVRQLLQSSRDRGDLLFTSHLALGEVLAGVRKLRGEDQAAAVDRHLRILPFEYLPFGNESVKPFSVLRATEKLKGPDCIHLACAAAAGIDLFLTGDKQLLKLHIPGIQFIADFDTPIL